MKTTLDLRDDLLLKAKQQAAKEHISLTRMIEEGFDSPSPAQSERSRSVEAASRFPAQRRAAGRNRE
jgi:RIO-like serine/threonine protein kinase